MDVDVVVAGAGPVGLLLACELRLAGTRVLVLERDTDPEQPIKEGEMGARSLNAPSVLALHRRGLLPQVKAGALFWWDPEEKTEAASEPEPAREDRPPVFAGHFAGIGLRADLLDPDDPDLGSHVLGAGVISQGALERVLAGRARELGVDIRRGVGVTDLEIDEGGVTVHAGAERVRTGWLVGCDGGRSTVRKLAGFDFPGCDAELIFRQALVDMTEPERLLPCGMHHTDTGAYLLGGWEMRLRPTRIVLIEPGELPTDRDEPVTAAELEAAIKRVAGFDTTVTAIHAASRYSDTTRQASTYRRDRVLLAGDAAHVHSPAGGQGLNLGIGDAMNLGWKLAATVHGWAPAGLLDTYTTERHPLGAWVQDWTKAQSALGRRDPRTQALRDVVADLLESTHGATYVMKKIAGVAQRYAASPDHLLVGRPAPEIAVEPESMLADHGHPGRFVLVLAEPADPDSRLAAWGDRLDVVTVAPNARSGPTAFLVRPDGYVAWATDSPTDAASVQPALTAWLGLRGSASHVPPVLAAHLEERLGELAE